MPAVRLADAYGSGNFKGYVAVAAYYVDLPGGPDDGAAAGACIFDTAVLRFLTAALACPGGL